MRILIADDHGIVRQGLRSLIEKDPGMEVIGEAEDGQRVVELVGELLPDVVIMDVTMPKLNGIEATRLILQKHPGVNVIVLSMHPDKHIVKETLEAGASGYVLKSYLFDELSRALEAVAANERYLSPRVAGIVVEDYVRQPSAEATAAPAKLTSRERQIVQLLAEGKATKEIARLLHISPKTADANRRRIMNKLDISSVAELTKYAIREGLTSTEF
jgi:DNA-binding NarL/FixJ family response regulator